MTDYTYAVFDSASDEILASLTIEGPPSGAGVLRFAAFACSEVFDRAYYLTTPAAAEDIMRVRV